MKIAIASDHAGFEAKEALKRWFEKELGCEVSDFGTNSTESCDYPDFARPAAEAVASGECERGVLVCGSGIGMALAANKVPGARAAAVYSDYLAEMSRRHNDTNVICLAARINSLEDLKGFVKIWLKAPFEGGRHGKRVTRIIELDAGR